MTNANGYNKEKIVGKIVESVGNAVGGLFGGGGGGGGGAPAVPDYASLAEQTAANNLKAAQAATAANRVSQRTPYGNLDYTQTGTDSQGNPMWTATQTIAPELQGLTNKVFGGLEGQYGQNFTGGNLPSYGINPGENYSDAIMRRLQPQMQMEQKQFDAQMANQGIPVGSEAYQNAARVFQQGQNDKQTSAITGGMGVGLQANQQQYGQNLTNYQLPLNIANQVKGLTTPGYVNSAQQSTPAGADLFGAGMAGYNAQMGQYNAKQAGNQNTMSGLFGLGAAGLMSPAGTFSGLFGGSSPLSTAGIQSGAVGPGGFGSGFSL